MKVVTTNGTLVKAEVAPGGRPLTEDEAEALCRECNDKAEKLGVETRYEVKD